MVVWQIALYILLGGLVIAGGTVGLVFLAAKANTKSLAHDQATCDCLDCQRRRREAAAKVYVDMVDHNDALTKRDEPANIKAGWRSTKELLPNMHVHFRDETWRVVDLLPGRRAGGLTIHMVNLTTGKFTFIPISAQYMNNRFWMTRPPDWPK